jgi:hypothetical protein
MTNHEQYLNNILTSGLNSIAHEVDVKDSKFMNQLASLFDANHVVALNTNEINNLVSLLNVCTEGFRVDFLNDLETIFNETQVTSYKDKLAIVAKGISKNKNLNAVKYASIPKPLPNPDFTGLIEEADEFINALATGGRTKDTKEYMFENVMITIYGKDIFEFINKCYDGGMEN